MGDTEQKVPEGCTPEDARILREANHRLAEENQQMRRTLRFYANRRHIIGLKDWEGPSDDYNWLCPPLDEGERAAFIEDLDENMVEDGTVARQVLAGQFVPFDPEDEPPPVKGEAEYEVEQMAAEIATTTSGSDPIRPSANGTDSGRKA